MIGDLDLLLRPWNNMSASDRFPRKTTGRPIQKFPSKSHVEHVCPHAKLNEADRGCLTKSLADFCPERSWLHQNSAEANHVCLCLQQPPNLPETLVLDGAVKDPSVSVEGVKPKTRGKGNAH